MTEREKKPVTRRAKGELTRTSILQATIQVLANNGIKGTTHRAVAQQADIQLSLTTYYFKDIKELVREAFILHIQQQKKWFELLWQQIDAAFNRYGKTALRKKSNRLEMCASIAQASANFILQRMKEDPNGVAVDMVLFTEAQFCAEQLSLAEHYRHDRLQPLIDLCAVFVKEQPQVSAKIIFNIFRQAEIEQIALPNSAMTKDELELMIKRVMVSMVEHH